MSRYACRVQFMAMLRGRTNLTGVTITPTWPGDKGKAAENIWTQGSTGTRSYPNSMAGSLTVDDEFSFVVKCRTTGHPNLDAAAVRAEELIAEVHAAVAETADLDGFGESGVFTVIECSPGDLTTDEADSPEGPVGYGEFTVNVHLRIY